MKALVLCLAAICSVACSDDRGGSGTNGEGGCLPLPFVERTGSEDNTVFGTAIDATGVMAGLYRSGSNAHLLVFDARGEASADTNLNGYSPDGSFASTAEGGFIYAGRSLAMIDLDGTQQWAFDTPLVLVTAVPSQDGGAWGIYRNKADVEIGGEILADGAGLVLVRVSADGSYQRHSKVSAASVRGPLRVSPLDDGAFVLAGEFEGQLNFEGQSAVAPERSDFVARINADGSAAWVTVFEDTTNSTQVFAKHALTTFADETLAYIHRDSNGSVLHQLSASGEVLHSERLGSGQVGSRGVMLSTTPTDDLAVFYESREDGIAVLELREPGAQSYATARICLPDGEDWFMPGGVAISDDAVVLGGALQRANEPGNPDRAQLDAIFFAGPRSAFKLQ